MVLPNTPLIKQQLLDVLAIANGKAAIRHKPFSAFAPLITDVIDPPGPFVPGTTYNRLAHITDGGYEFIAAEDGITVPPLDPVSGDPNPGWVQPWYSALARCRAETKAAADRQLNLAPPLYPWEQSVSGPWPCGWWSRDYDQQYLYFPDTGQAESVGVVSTCPSQLYHYTVEPRRLVYDGHNWFFGYELVSDTVDPVTGIGERIYNDRNNTGPVVGYKTSLTFKIVVGGQDNGALTGSVILPFDFQRGKVWFNDTRPGGSFSITDDPRPLSDFLGYITVDDSNWIPGSTWTVAVVSGIITASCTTGVSVAPGEYTVVFTITVPEDTADDEWHQIYDGMVDGEPHLADQWILETVTYASRVVAEPITNSLSLAISCTNQEAANGIHDTKAVKRIPLPLPNPISKIPWGLYCKYRTPETFDAYGNPLTWGVDQLGGGGWTVNSTVKGYWFGKTPPITSLGLMPLADMPWNYFHAPAGGNPVNNQYLGYRLPFLDGYAFDATAYQAYGIGDSPVWVPSPNSASSEMQPWPKIWKQYVFYPGGFTIQDRNGNRQTSTRAGRSGLIEPVWPRNLGSETTEPDYVNNAFTPPRTEVGVQWKLTKVLRPIPDYQLDHGYSVGDEITDSNGNTQTAQTDGDSDSTAEPDWATTLNAITEDGFTLRWKLTRINPIFAPPVSHLCPPQYPVLWQNPTTPQTDRPITQMNSPVYDPATWNQGWWIYRVTLNRVGTRANRGIPPAGAVDVQLGCVRNGVFVSFGTFQTGQTIDGYWPIFTRTALAYRCTEKVDVQALIMTCGLGYGTWGGPDFPMAAAYLNDLENALDLLT